MIRLRGLQFLALFGHSCNIALCKFRDNIPGGKGGPVTTVAKEKSMSSRRIDFGALQVKGRKFGQNSSWISESLTNFKNVVSFLFVVRILVIS